jgi:membrane protease YdiL (CAAX protease family)
LPDSIVVRRVIGLSLVVYIPMLAGTLFLAPPGEFVIRDWPRFGYALAGAAVAVVALVLGSRWIARKTGWGRHLRHEFRAALGPLTSVDILWLSLLSGFGEEIVFRGVLLGRIGLIWSSVAFAAMHFPFRLSLWPWTAFAGIMGLGLAAVTQWAGLLWPAIFIHLCVNYFNLHDIVEADQPIP